MAKGEGEAWLRELRRRIASNVRAQRKLRGWTQEEAAELCGLETRTWQGIEAERSNVSMRTLAVLAAGLEVDPLVLLAPVSKSETRTLGRPPKSR